MGISTSSCKLTGLSIYSKPIGLVICASSVACSLPSISSVPSFSSLAKIFGIVGVNDDIWVATNSYVLSGFQMYEDLISPTTFGVGETWLICEVRFCREEHNSISL